MFAPPKTTSSAEPKLGEVGDINKFFVISQLLY
jgi:hypothetical protein